MAIVLPDSNLTNPSLKYVREFIIQNAKIIGVVSLPQETFVPHGAGVKTSLLFLQKLDEEKLRQVKKQNYPIFMALCKKIGYRVLKKKAFPVYKIDEEGNKVIDSDIKVIYQGFQDFLSNSFRDSEDIYAIKYSEIEEQAEKRIDVEYYTPEQKHNIRTIVNLKRNKNWKIVKLGEITQIKKGIEIGSEAYKTEGIPYIRVQNLSEIGFSENNLTYLDNNLYETLKSFNPQPKEILYSKDATVGIAYLVESSEFLENKFITSGGIVRIKIKNEKEVIPEFLIAILNSDTCKLQAVRESIGGVIKHLSIQKIKEILIPLPPMDYQQKIAKSIENSYKLRKESKTSLNEAKQKIIEIILEK